MLIKIQFEDYWQDYLTWVIDTEKESIVECEPFQADIWVGKTVRQKIFEVGGRVTWIDAVIEHVIPYPIESVEVLTPKLQMEIKNNEDNMLDKCRIDLVKAYRGVLDTLRMCSYFDEGLNRLVVVNAERFEEAMGELHNAVIFVCALEAKGMVEHVLDHPEVDADNLVPFTLEYDE